MNATHDERMHYLDEKHTPNYKQVDIFLETNQLPHATVLLFRATGVGSTSHYSYELQEQALRVTSWTAQPYSKPAVNRQPGFRREDSQSRPPSIIELPLNSSSFFTKKSKILKIFKNIIKISIFWKISRELPSSFCSANEQPISYLVFVFIEVDGKNTDE